ncbi:MAG: FAD-dependent pyridine nucleotide-disulfide oxidoreductase [Candidatus Jorgensenbacteria bacterium GW2011_GWC1_48_8]|uniref:FAD-dependent pyridine nucleotide-disulfide oxidoreductase n=1 Tax=Candidatus Jorgensenbacteria bacterium GW2011_GWC1_48_8 TaxID=1618666 RepID=A0A0G1UWK7_9BACT|nr:MAG: FAD-dependent pyridine nucleotide-disulfide oxidoreductase [Candidatus Jorgensenbacteria bacterium GW2011_GWC1_48_8]
MKNIVILGGGFGGVQAALTLEKKLKKLRVKNDYEIILVDKEPHHTFTPLLYEAATTSKNLADYVELKSLVSFPFAELFKDKNIRVVNDVILHIDTAEGLVHLKQSKIRFEYLVVALGAETNYFNMFGLEENALPLKTFMDAIRLRDAIWRRAEEGAERLRVVIGGGGSTGVELASEIKEWTCELQEEVNKSCNIDVMIIEGSKNILPGFDGRVVRKVEKRLKKIGVAIVRDEKVDKVTQKDIILESAEKIAYDILVWAGGVKAVPLTEKMPLKKEKRGRIEIMGGLECIPESPDLKIYGKIYAVGDAACIINPKTNLPVPQVARAAITQGKIAAKNIIEDIKKQNFLSKKIKQYVYKPMNYPYIVPVGGKYAVAKIGLIVISGLLAWIFKGVVELNYFLSIMNPFKALKIWLHGLRVFIQNDRLG